MIEQITDIYFVFKKTTQHSLGTIYFGSCVTCKSTATTQLRVNIGVY